jgi:modulator of FtsH protease HflK
MRRILPGPGSLATARGGDSLLPVTNGNRTVIDLPSMPRLPKLPLGSVKFIVVAVLALVVAFSAFYTVEPEEVGVVMRFGRFVNTTEPGLHFKLPFGIDRVFKVPVQRQLKQEFGFRTVRAAVRSEFRKVENESNMLTGDLNAAIVEWVVQYRVDDPYDFLFRVREVEKTLGDLSEAVMRQVVGDRTVDEVLTVGRQEVADLVESKLQELCTQYEMGIKIEQVVLQDVTPPDPVKPSFNAVNQAEQERETLINQAQSNYNKVIFRAQGEAKETVEKAEGYAIDRVNRAEGEANRFKALYGEYRKAPEVTRKRMYLETMNDVLPKMGSKIIVDDDLKGILPLLNLQNTPAANGGGQQ